MATKQANGVAHKFDPNFTQNVIKAIGPKAAPRARQVIGSLIQHLHDFARENEITVDEWMAAVNFVSMENGRIIFLLGVNTVR
jgi:catechol 1,2-dioxygenase